MSNSRDDNVNDSECLDVAVAEELPLSHGFCELFAYPYEQLPYKQFDNGDLNKNSLAHLQKQREKGQFCDVAFLAAADGTKLVAHRSVLAGASDYFATMFTSKMKESTDAEITMENVRGDVLEAIVDYCYTNSIVIKINNVQAIYMLAHLMQLREIVEACSQFLTEVLHPSNCLQIQMFAELMSDNDLLGRAKSYLEKHFDEVVEKSEFLQLSVDQLMLLLKRDHLKVEYEEYRFNAVKNWVDHNRSERQIHVPSLLRFVELNLLEHDFLVNTVEDFLPDDPAYKTMLVDLLKLNLSDNEGGSRPKRLASNKSIEFGRILVVGRNVSNPDNSFIECYHPEDNTWSHSHKMYNLNLNFETALLNEKLYVIRETSPLSSPSQSLCLNLKNGVWSESITMNLARSNFGVAVLNGYIYVIGGFIQRYNDRIHLSSVECWKPTETVWNFVSPLNTQREGLNAVALGGKLYAVGGHIDVHCKTETMECYDPRRDEWTHCEALPSRSRSLVVVASDKYLYAICEPTEKVPSGPDLYFIERYYPETNSWGKVTQLLNKRDYIAACLYGERILIISDYDGNNKLTTVEQYDLKSNTMTTNTFSQRYRKTNVRLVVVPTEFI